MRSGSDSAQMKLLKPRVLVQLSEAGKQAVASLRCYPKVECNALTECEGLSRLMQSVAKVVLLRWVRLRLEHRVIRG